MKTPRNYTEAIKTGYKTKKVTYCNNRQVRVDLEITGYANDRKPFLSFWLSKKGCERLGIIIY
jgi:hypothetical protein